MDRLKEIEPALVAILKGGLGNQLFIYAACKGAAVRSGRHLYLDTLIAYAADSFGRDYQLDHFGIEVPEVPPALRLAPDLRHWRHKLRRAWNKCLPDERKTYIADRGRDELLHLRSDQPVVHALGYWQSERFFADELPKIRAELSLPEPDCADCRETGLRFRQSGAVALHLRRERFPMVVDLNYYQAAIDALHECEPSAPFVLFGDSVGLALLQLNFRGHSVTPSPGGLQADALHDFWLMAQCRHAVLSNSSFAWWATWFGDVLHEGRQVYAPRDYGWRMEPSAAWTCLPNRILRSE